MIRDLLGPHDATRPSEMRVGNRNRRVEAEVKLYDEERVQQAETTEAFARHQEAARARQDAAEKAQATRRARIEAQITAYVEAYRPNISPPIGSAHPGNLNHWQANLCGLDAFRFSPEADALLDGLRGQDRRDAENRLYNKHRAAFHATFGTEPQP